MFINLKIQQKNLLRYVNMLNAVYFIRTVTVHQQLTTCRSKMACTLFTYLRI